MKMITFNCPAYKGLTRDIPDWLDNTNCGQYTGQVSCQDCIDCVMKQIVEKCKKETRVYRNTLLPADGTNTIHFGRQSFAYDVLQLLDIQEVE